MNRARARRLARDLQAMTMPEVMLVMHHIQQDSGQSAVDGIAKMVVEAATAPITQRARLAEMKLEILLRRVGDKKIQVIKVMREATGLGLKEAKLLVDSAPIRVVDSIAEISSMIHLSNAQLQIMHRNLVAAGANADIGSPQELGG